MREIAPNVYVSSQYPGANVGFLVLPVGVVAVDAPALPQDAMAWRQEILARTDKPILYLVLTDANPDRLLSAAALGAPIIASMDAYHQAAAYTEGFWRGVIDGWARRHPSAAEDLAGLGVVLPEIMFSSRLTLHRGGGGVTVETVHGAAPGSLWMYLPEQDVLFAGDTVVAGTHPIMAISPGTQAWLVTLQSLRRPRYAKTVIVPGRGPLCDGMATSVLSDYIATARRRVRALHAAGRPRAETAGLVAELLPLFPVVDEERDLVQRRVKASLDRLYEELRQG